MQGSDLKDFPILLKVAFDHESAIIQRIEPEEGHGSFGTGDCSRLSILQCSRPGISTTAVIVIGVPSVGSLGP
jgi:hypothetical protein